MNKTVAEIVKEYMQANGYTALLSDDGECGCSLDTMFMCSVVGVEKCQLGYWHSCGKCRDRESIGCEVHPLDISDDDGCAQQFKQEEE